MKVTTHTPPTKRLVTIEMTEDEAQSLRIICTRIAGHPNKSRRGHFDWLALALDNIGITVLPRSELRDDPRSQLYFLNREDADGLAE